MGRGHATSGYLGGLGMVAALPWAPWSVRLLAVAVTGGAALLPDLDTASSTASRSLGFLTRWIAHGVAWVSIEVYHATRLDGDPAARDNPHRLITHTPVGSLAFGGVVAVACLAHPIAGGVVIGLLIALGVTAVPTLHRAGNRLPGGGLAVLVVSAGGAWWVLTYENACGGYFRSPWCGVRSCTAKVTGAPCKGYRAGCGRCPKVTSAGGSITRW